MSIDIWKTINKELKRQEKSIYWLSKAAGVPETTIRNYKNGIRPTVDTADLLLRALGIEIKIGKHKPPKEA